jgi:SSS family solute:Na+ symporter
MPWTVLLIGLWIPNFYYCGLNQFIVQRSLGAKNLKEGQLGVIFAGALWLLVPFAIVFPGIMAVQLYGQELVNADQAYPLLIKNLIPAGLRGFIFAALCGAVISSLASVLNSASTIFTMDLYRKHWRPQSSEKNLVRTGRIMTLVFVAAGCLIAPNLGNFAGIFSYIQEFQGFISPGILAAFIFGFLIKRAPGKAGTAALLLNVPLYGLLYIFFSGAFPAVTIATIAFLNRMAITFVIIIVVMTLITAIRPLDKPVTMPVQEDFDMTPARSVIWFGGIVIAAVVTFFIIFW